MGVMADRQALTEICEGTARRIPYGEVAFRITQPWLDSSRVPL